VRRTLPIPAQGRGPSAGLLGAYPENVLIGLLIVLLDLAAIGGLIVAIVVTASRPRPSQPARPSVATFRRWTSLIALVAALGLVVLGNAWVLISGYDQGRPGPAQVVGTWPDRDGATLRVQRNGTFLASSLPTDSDDPAADGKPHPTDGRGTWQITSVDGASYAVFTYSGGSRFQLYVGSSASPGGASTAMFSDAFAQYNAVNLWAFHRRQRHSAASRSSVIAR
jgi:hypothetical protein